MKFTTTKEQEDLRKRVREFAEKEIKPVSYTHLASPAFHLPAIYISTAFFYA